MTRWNRWAVAKLKDEYQERGITCCEIRLPGCKGAFFLSFAHRKKRRYYYSDPEKLGDINETVLACQHCHDQIEQSRSLTEEVFNRLRPIDE
ncbi:MAG: hypothetical protein AB9866_18910 [Syntrophobacteraceae bacterium]